MRKYLSLILLIATVIDGLSQSTDTLQTRQNTIKLNLVHRFLYNNAITMSYERLTKRPNQSWGIMLGYIQFPKIGSLGPTVNSTNEINNVGYVIGGEYRFYLKKENKYAAPHGVYIGPFVNYFSFQNERQLTLVGSDGVTLTQANLNTDIHALNIGVQLGYQFVINDRWTFDMVFIGPSLSNYSLNSKLTGDISQEALLENKIIAALVDKFPLVKDLVEGQNVNLQGSNSKWGTGFRYQFNIGYRFGAKKSR